MGKEREAVAPAGYEARTATVNRDIWCGGKNAELILSDAVYNSQ